MLNNKLNNMKHINYNQARRIDMIQQGAYDGRFKNKVIKDKKKEESKKSCRKFNFLY